MRGLRSTNCVLPFATDTWLQTAEWDEPESDLDDGHDVLDLQGEDGAGGAQDSWAGALLKTNLGGFLHGLTGTKVGDDGAGVTQAPGFLPCWEDGMARRR